MSNELRKRDNFNLNTLDSSDLKDAIVSFISAKKDYEITKEQERTKRMSIEVNLEKYVTKINQTRDFLSGHLLEQYSLRREAMDKVFSILEKALENDKDEVVMQALSTVEGILKESPLKEVEKIGQAFSGDGDLEI